MDGKIKNLIFLGSLVALVLFLTLVSYADDNSLLKFTRSGGFAGMSDEVELYNTGHAKVKVRGLDYRARLDAKSIKRLVEILENSPSANRSWSKPSEPECCDMIYSYIKYQGKYLNLSDDTGPVLSPEDLAEFIGIIDWAY